MESGRHQDDPARRTRLRWRSRRCFLEYDMILTRFLDLHEVTLSDDEVDALTRLLELPDNDLMSLLLGQNDPTEALDLPNVKSLLVRLRAA